MYDMEPLLARLRSEADPDYRAFTLRLLPGLPEEFLGVRAPALRAMAKELCREDWRGFLEAAPSAPVHEARLLQAMVLGKARCPVEERVARVAAFIPAIDNWAVCDTLCTGLKPKPGEREALFALCRECAASTEEYRKRFGLVALMAAFNAEDWADRALACYRGFSHPGYYARMGAAWGLATFYLKRRDAVLDMLRSGELDDFTHNKTIQKICESFRVSPEDRDEARALRRRKAGR